LTNQLPKTTVLIPVYNDETTIEEVVLKCIKIIKPEVASLQIVLINDCSPDNSASILKKLADKFKFIDVITHEKNLGYGGTLKSAVLVAKYELCCMIDGDNEYDVADLLRMLRLHNSYGLIIGFRYKKLYSNYRIFVSYVYNKLIQFFFKINFRDISTGSRVFKKSILSDINLKSDSSFIGAELTIKAMYNGIAIGELGLQTFPSEFRSGASVKLINILKTIIDMLRVRREIFSDSYQLPSDRQR